MEKDSFIQEFDESTYSRWHFYDRNLQMALDTIFPTSIEEKRWKKAQLDLSVKGIEPVKKVINHRKAAA